MVTNDLDRVFGCQANDLDLVSVAKDGCHGNGNPDTVAKDGCHGNGDLDTVARDGCHGNDLDLLFWLPW